LLLLAAFMVETLRTYFWVALGGATGSVARFALATFLTSRLASAGHKIFPLPILIVNVTGSLLIGVIAAWAVPEGRMSPAGRMLASEFLMAGVCGGYTTFSSFSLQTFQLMQTGHWFAAGANILLSVTLCLVGTWLGWCLGQGLAR
jgi:fluoride exporter